MLHFDITLKDSDFPYIICLLCLKFLPYLRTRLSRIIVRVYRNSQTRGRASSYEQKDFRFGKTAWAVPIIPTDPLVCFFFIMKFKHIDV